MSLNVGELFINLAIKGTEKTVGALTSIGHGMGDLRNLSLETKAGILGLAYGFQQMMAASGRAGTNLINFSATTGLAAADLQAWQYAAIQAGDTTDDFTNSVMGVQQSINNMLLNKGGPEYLNMIVQHVKEFDPSRVRDTFYVMQKLQEAARNMPKDLGTTMLLGFGVGRQTIASFQRNAFRKDVLERAPIYNDRELKALDRANIAWANLRYNIERAFGRFNASHGVHLVSDISHITSAIIKLVEVLTKVADKFHLFEKLESLIGFTASAIEGAASDVTAIEKEMNQPKLTIGKDIAKTIGSAGWHLAKGIASTADEFAKGIVSKPLVDLPKLLHLPQPKVPAASDAIVPHMASHAGHHEQNIHVKQDVHFHGAHEAPKRTADALHKQIGDYVKQNPSKLRGA